MSSIGEILVRARERLGLTQAEVAARVGCDRTYVSHLETGRPGMSLQLAGRVARALELTDTECAAILDLAAGAAVAGTTDA